VTAANCLLPASRPSRMSPRQALQMKMNIRALAAN
jgi:hypothetical protein